MKNATRLGWVITCGALLVAGCSDDGGEPNSPDGGGVDVGHDSARGDAGAPKDSGLPAMDAAIADAEDDASEPDASNGPPSLLLFSRTEGFRHGSIEDAIGAITAAAGDSMVTATEDPTVFEDASLANYDVVVFVMTTGDILDAEQQGALERFVADGKGWVGIHSASDTEYDWEWYGGLVGAYFDNHPSIQEASIDVEVSDHPSTTHLPARWTRRDEWYNFRGNPRSEVTVLMTLDESTYNGGSMGDDHPIAWCHEYGGGRSWYTAGGHTKASYADEDFVAHIMGGIAYAAGESSCR